MAAKQEFYVDIDLKQKRSILNARIETVTTLPTGDGAFAGRLVYYNGKLYTYDGTNSKWIETADASEVSTLKTTVGDSSAGLVKSVADNTSAISDLQTAVGDGTGLTSRVSTLETAVGKSTDTASATGSLYARTTQNAAAASAAQSAAEGAQSTADTAKSTADANKTAIGATTDTASASGSLYARIAQNKADIATLNTKVGTAKTDTAAATGLYKDVADNASAITALQTSVGTNTSDISSLKTGKVDVVDGKGLSTNDYTTTEKNKLAGIDEGAEVNVIEKVSLDGTALTVTDKGVNIALADTYAKKSDLTSVYKVKGTVASASALPADASVGDVYNVTASFTDNGKTYPAGTNVVYVASDGDTQSGKWDALAGITDLSAYATTEDVNKKQDALSEAQLAAANSGITSTKVTTYDGYADTISNKVDKLSTKPTAGTYPKVTINAEGQVTAGTTLAATDVPDLDAAKITSGTFDAARIPTLSITDKTTGTLPVARLGIAFESVGVTTTADTATSVSFTTIDGTPYLAVVTDSSGNQVGCVVTYGSSGLTITTAEAVTLTVRAIGARKSS